ncbi:flagellar brake protein [Marinibactrum halimedae]|uniref:PilZ domain-containing protein n=1 Tax=Marinibactrum halimedae TaxID=1444977 RepID=A0AA37T9N3_9GAMM|nr:flagellar brake protein [Marinibactrum halimedae]MCD9459903.1 flagellar brake protein [Marinibactrum halimedae]GLS25242.1 hypothetical protein GCM10007877_09560 [Marinibactrum halimedae]
MDFSQLQLRYGYPIQLHVMSTRGEPTKLKLSLYGACPGHGLMVSMPRSAVSKRLRSGLKVMANIMLSNGICSFPARILSTANSPVPMIYLSYPERITFKEIRGATRVEVDESIRAENLSSIEERVCSGVLGDISISGARLKLNDPIADIGDELRISSDILIGQNTYELDLVATVRARVERTTREVEENVPAVFGVEFTELSKQQQLTLHAYVYHRMIKDPTFISP